MKTRRIAQPAIDGSQVCQPSSGPMMSQQPSLLLFVVATSVALLVGCATGPKTRLEHQLGESVVLIGEEPAGLAHRPMRSQPLSIRNTYLPGQGTVEYVEGRDYVIDYAEGKLRRTPGSR